MIRAMQRSDVAAALEGWNRALAFDKREEAEFQRTIFDDPLYEPQGAVVAAEDGRIVGLSDCVVRLEEGKPGMAHLKGIFFENAAVGRALLEEACRFARSRAAGAMKAVENPGCWFFPGIDLRYKDLIGEMKSFGFEQIREGDDCSLDLRKHPPGQGQYQQGKRSQAKRGGVEIVPWNEQMLDPMERFVQEARRMA